MAKNYTSDELALRTFVITIVGAALYVAAVFLFIL